MNQESLERANAFLAAIAARVEVGGTLRQSPSDIGRQLGVTEPLACARAVRALLARRRLEAADGSYRLVNASPVQAGEKESVQRPRRSAAKAKRAGPKIGGRPTYSELGREAVDRLIELGREAAALRASLKAAREEARDARLTKDEAERRAHTLAARVHELEARADMAESNLRTLLAAAKGSGRDTAGADTPVTNNEMEAILGVLKGGGGEPH